MGGPGWSWDEPRGQLPGSPGEGCSLHLTLPIVSITAMATKTTSTRQFSVLMSHGQSAPLAMAASPPPRRPSSFNFQGPCFSSPSLTQHLRLFHFFFLFSTSSKCGSTQGFNRQTCLFHQHSFFEEVSSIFFFSAMPHSLWDLSSLTKDQTLIPCSGSEKS